jgi:4-hydroxy-tetrahydrodipicolinate synthase
MRRRSSAWLPYLRSNWPEFGKTRLPLYLGLSGRNTRKVAAELEHTASWPIHGYLIACPYYTRPSQEGLVRHFSLLADATNKPILIYNIPYRTGVNLRNEAMLDLADYANVVGVKDCSADPAQSFDLTRRKPPGFAVLASEDPFYYSALTQGGDGGKLASAHVRTRAFREAARRRSAGRTIRLAPALRSSAAALC